MKTTLLRCTVGIALLALTTSSQAAFVTLSYGGLGPLLTNTLTIGSNETAIVRGGFDGKSPPDYYLEVSKAGEKIRLGESQLNFTSAAAGKPVFAGPAVFTLKTWNPAQSRLAFESAFVTIEIIPESFPPDKTLVVPAGTGGANIVLEGSTDLIHWSNSAPGAYTNLDTHMFFRIRADRIP